MHSILPPHSLTYSTIVLYWLVTYIDILFSHLSSGHICLEDFIEAATCLRMSALPHVWTGVKFALDLGLLGGLAQGADCAD